MSYLHSKGILHRSLKPENIFLDDFGLSSFFKVLSPKIGDFGLSTRFDYLCSLTHQSIAGMKATPIYSAPEVLQFNEYSKACDVYSFAFIVFYILTNEIPFDEISNNNQKFNEIVNNQSRPLIKETIPESYKILIEKCWDHNPGLRPTFDEIVYELRNNSDFITLKNNKEYYIKYISFIDENTDKSTAFNEYANILTQQIQENKNDLSLKDNEKELNRSP